MRLSVFRLFRTGDVVQNSVHFCMFGTNVWQMKNERFTATGLRCRQNPKYENTRRHLADYVKTLHRRACHTCSTIVFPNSTNQITDLSRCRYRCRRHFLMNSLFFSSLKRIFQFYFSQEIPLLKLERRISQIRYMSRFTMKLSWTVLNKQLCKAVSLLYWHSKTWMQLASWKKRLVIAS